MKLPQEVLDCVNQAVEAHPDDLDKSIEIANQVVRSLPNFREFRDALISSAIADLVYENRHRANVQLRNQANGYGGAAKVQADAESVRQVYRSVYDYFIAGRTLGSIFGRELADLAANEREKADGHAYNAKLCERLAAMVPADKTVRESVPEKKLKKLFERERKRDAA